MIERLIWVVPVLVIVFGAWRPRAGLVVLAAALPLFGVPPGGPYLAALDVAGLAAIVTAWRAGRPRPSALAWPAAAFVVVSLASLLPSPYLPPSWRPSDLLGVLRALPAVEGWPALYTWRAAVDLLLGWGLFLAVRRAFSGRSPLPLAWGLLVGLAGTLLVGMAARWGLLNLDAYRPDYHVHFSAAGKRLASVFFLSGWFSQFIVIVAPLGLAALQIGQRRLRHLGPVLLALTVTCLALTQQRGAWIAAMVQVCLWAVMSWRSGGWKRSRLREIIAMAGVTIAVGVVFVARTPNLPAQLLHRANVFSSGLGPRGPVWVGTLEMVGERPVLGSGLGSFVPAYDLVRPVPAGEPKLHRGTAHNLYLHVAAERGILGLTALGLLAWGVAVCLRQRETGHEVLAMALAVSLLGAAFYGLVQYMYYLRNIAWILWMLTGCAAVVSRLQSSMPLERLSRALTIGVLLFVPVRALFVQAPAYPGNREFGFHAPESHPMGAFQWTAGRAARRIPWVGEYLVLSVANGHPRAAEHPATVEVAVDGQPLDSIEVLGSWQEHRFRTGPPRRDWLVVSLVVRPVFRPFRDYRDYPDLQSYDIRALGVAVKNLRTE